ncbi:hypothetical protein CO683_40205 [Bradyrhizobium ottawaense]|nr:hypothetical protein CO683_40205 [Bradyrhizobium ottawaense]
MQSYISPETSPLRHDGRSSFPEADQSSKMRRIQLDFKAVVADEARIGRIRQDTFGLIDLMSASRALPS